MNDESFEVGRCDAGCDPDLDEVARGPVDVLDASSAVTADRQRFNVVVVVAKC